MMPALVPIQTRSLHANNDVTRKHAALCWRMMSSQLESILFTHGTRLISNNSVRLKRNGHLILVIVKVRKDGITSSSMTTLQNISMSICQYVKASKCQNIRITDVTSKGTSH